MKKNFFFLILASSLCISFQSYAVVAPQWIPIGDKGGGILTSPAGDSIPTFICYGYYEAVPGSEKETIGADGSVTRSWDERCVGYEIKLRGTTMFSDL